MIASPVNDLYYSFCLYLDRQIQQKGRAYTSNSGLFYKAADPELPNNTVYSLPYKQMVSDFSITGAIIPTGVWINNVFATKGVSGLKIDYNNGRAILSGGAAYQNLSISGAYSIKDFNIYPTTKSDEDLIFESKFQLNPSYSRTLSGVAKDALVVPGIFITTTNFKNTPLEFGGMVYTNVNIHMVIIADSKDLLDAVGNLIIDEKYSSFPIVTSNKLPFNAYGDYKTGSVNFNYLSLVRDFTSSLGYIEEANFYKLSNKDFNGRYPDLKVGLADLKIKVPRLPNRGA